MNRRGIVGTGFLAVGLKLLAEQDKPKMVYDMVDEQLDALLAEQGIHYRVEEQLYDFLGLQLREPDPVGDLLHDFFFGHDQGLLREQAKVLYHP